MEVYGIGIDRRSTLKLPCVRAYSLPLHCGSNARTEGLCSLAVFGKIECQSAGICVVCTSSGTVC